VQNEDHLGRKEKEQELGLMNDKKKSQGPNWRVAPNAVWGAERQIPWSEVTQRGGNAAQKTLKIRGTTVGARKGNSEIIQDGSFTG